MVRAALALLLTLAAGDALASDADLPRGVWVHFGGEYHFASDPSPRIHLNGFFYPELGIVVSQPRFFVDAKSILPIVIPDGIWAAGDFLSGGKGTLPILERANSHKEPGEIDVFALDARATLAAPGSQKVDAGVRLGAQFLSPFVDGDRVSLQPLFAGPSFGYAVELRQPDVHLDASVFAGNAWTRFARFNPVYGGTARVRLEVTRRFGLYADGKLSREWIDMRDARQDVTGPILGVREWFTLGSVESGISIQL